MKNANNFIFVEDTTDRTTAFNMDIYSLSYITCLKDASLKNMCPPIEEAEGEEPKGEGTDIRQYNALPSEYERNTIKEFGIFTIFSVMFLTFLLYRGFSE